MIIYNMRLAGFLMSEGFILTKMDKDKKNPKFNIFIFEDSVHIRNKIEFYKNTKTAKPLHN